MSAAMITLAGVNMLAMRVSYVGELGWELHLAADDLSRVYAEIERRVLISGWLILALMPSMPCGSKKAITAGARILAPNTRCTMRVLPVLPILARCVYRP